MVKKVIMVLKIGQNPAPQRNKVITNAIFQLACYYFKIHDNTSRGEKSHLLLQDLRIAFPKAITIIQELLHHLTASQKEIILTINTKLVKRM